MSSTTDISIQTRTRGRRIRDILAESVVEVGVELLEQDLVIRPRLDGGRDAFLRFQRGVLIAAQLGGTEVLATSALSA